MNKNSNKPFWTEEKAFSAFDHKLWSTLLSKLTLFRCECCFEAIGHSSHEKANHHNLTLIPGSPSCRVSSLSPLSTLCPCHRHRVYNIGAVSRSHTAQVTTPPTKTWSVVPACSLQSPPRALLYTAVLETSGHNWIHSRRRYRDTTAGTGEIHEIWEQLHKQIVSNWTAWLCHPDPRRLQSWLNWFFS